MLDLEFRGDHCRLTLDAGRGNSLRPELLAGLERELERAASLAPGLILAARGRSFCTGLDLRWASRLDRAQMAELMEGFDRTLAALWRFAGPTVAAVGGNALAGGALLALACDARLIGRGAGVLGIHGARMGIAYPDIAIEIVRARLGRSAGEAMLYGGEIFAAEQAVERGFAHAVVPPEQLLPQCEAWLHSHASAPASAQNKGALFAAAWARLSPPDAAGQERWLEHWFAASTQAHVRAALDAADRSTPGEAL